MTIYNRQSRLTALILIVSITACSAPARNEMPSVKLSISENEAQEMLTGAKRTWHRL